MKNSNRLITSLLLISFAFTGCYKGDLTSTTEEIISSGKWVVNYYYENQDLTGEYGNYRFVFNTNGTVTSTRNNVISSGSWKKFTDASKQEFISIEFITNDVNIAKLSEQWKLTSKSSHELEFSKTNQSAVSQLHIAQLY
jgi:hypothetical protein